MIFKTKPYTHQLTAFERFKNSEYFALFHDCGVGKSKVAIDIASYRFQRKEINAVLVIAPNGVHDAWLKEQYPIHCSIPYVPFIWHANKATSRYYKEKLQEFLAEKMNDLKVFAINVEALQYDGILDYLAMYVKNHKVFIIMDEATRIKHATAKRSKTAHRLNKYGYRCILTGTPTAKSPFDLWSQMEFLKHNYFDCNFFVFQHRYGIMMKGVNPFGGQHYLSLIDEKTYKIIVSKLVTFEKMRGKAGLMADDYDQIAVIYGVSVKDVYFIDAHREYVQYKDMDKLREYIAKDVSSVRKEDCLDLPPKVYESIYVSMTDEQKKVYKNLKQELEATYSEKTLTVSNKVALTTRLMQVTGGFFPFTREQAKIVGAERQMILVSDSMPIGKENPKLTALIADIEELSDEAQIIVWAAFVPELKMIYAALSKLYKCCLYYGGTSTVKREEYKTAFQRGEYKIFIGNTATAGFGLNFQNAPFQIFYSNTFKTEDRLQAEDRSHRNGVKTTVVCKDIIVKGTVDELIYKNIATGRSLNDFFKAVSLKELLNTENENE